MLNKIDHNIMGKGDRGWLRSIFHFSFADYYNKDNIHFGPLRVINDDYVDPGTGFDFHPHDNMEIISYIIDGSISHEDTMGNIKEVSSGDIQYMSAGTGLRHKEYNYGTEVLRLLQIWIMPDKKGYTPNYGDLKLNWEDRVNKFLHIVSPHSGNGKIKINQDANIYATNLNKGKELEFNVSEGRIAYIVQIEGETSYNNVTLNKHDGLEVMEEDLLLKAKEDSHILIIEMNKESKY
ncbi:MAG: pirin family protein [Mycoplasmatales bacterium]